MTADEGEVNAASGVSVPLVELEHVFAARDEHVVLWDVSLRLMPGEQVVLLGPNGCGKSTLLKVMTCELYPMIRVPDGNATEGGVPEPARSRVRLFGRERWDKTELRRRMGVVSAELPGQPILATNGLDAVLTGFFSSSTLWPNLLVTSAMRERAEKLLKLVGAESLRSKAVGAMSAGQQRRVMIGRAMAGATEDGHGAVQMLLLDEPSNALDLAAQRDLREMLHGVAEAGTAILLVTHQVTDILPNMRRTLLMQQGRIVADGATAELLTSRRMSALYGREVEVDERHGMYFVR